MFKKGDNGYILITTLLLLLVLTIAGMAAIGTSTFENMLSGNIRLRERNVAKADGAVEMSTAIIERALREQDTRNFANIADPGLPNELRSSPFDSDNAESSADVTFSIDSHDVNVDIDRMYSRWMGGTAIEFASGYEGVGKSGGSGFITFFRINSNSEDIRDSSADVGAIYRYVPK